MKNLFVVLAFLVASVAFSQIPNAGFENWSGSPASPNGWVVSNSGGPPPIVTVTPVNDVHSGALAARGAVIDAGGGVGYPATMSAARMVQAFRPAIATKHCMAGTSSHRLAGTRYRSFRLSGLVALRLEVVFSPPLLLRPCIASLSPTPFGIRRRSPIRETSSLP